jgi:DNA-directed RNA polymerase specialized sigma24 family protein
MTRLRAGRPPKLSAEDCSAIEITYATYKGVTYASLADTYSVSVSTIKRAIMRARKGKR